MIRTWSQGQNAEGWFPGSWPGWDRMERLWETHLGICPWAPLVDHAISFCDEVEAYVRFTGDLELAREMYPKLRKFVQWLLKQCGPDGLLPAEGDPWCRG